MNYKDYGNTRVYLDHTPAISKAVPPAVKTQSSRGNWINAIPLPFVGMKKRCLCGKKFWTMEGYKGHYAYRHIWEA